MGDSNVIAKFGDIDNAHWIARLVSIDDHEHTYIISRPMYSLMFRDGRNPGDDDYVGESE